MAELAVYRRSIPVTAPPLIQGKTLAGTVSDSVSSLIVRGSLTDNPAERASIAGKIALLGGSSSSRIAFKAALRKAADESIDIRPLASELSRAARGMAADAFFCASLDCIGSGGSLLTRAAGDMASALARNLGDSATQAAGERSLRLLKSPERSVREAASRILISLCRHPATDARELAELAYDTGTKEGCFAAETALRLPKKIIDMPEHAA